ncbi:hypothetical protein [uncultured Marinobacter sp.]|uniref:hypothetical protein n=1 Tax=uncultured Marinobacter sp. TaxID=187379 RepID=UPI002612AE5A|nr:hypothetical protein [uncultured Marinobacter sp.]
MVRIFLLAASSLLCILPAQAQESGIVTIEGTRIRGDQEVPTVMYLVPWQPPEVDELRAPDEQLLVEHAFSPLDRYEFQRLVRYHDVFKAEQNALENAEATP